ncbi:MAG: conjugal transfer protein TraC [Candidatus Colwellbacteria bacterium CG10_big_fil_rev_8_21_14_0_10_41_28]|uniref:Conjugal transfer protein TraC n=1 Tax=Candidatus Colwellbacteria bacterium CG10_big_fil_rev_8_21_14_0_10_41_28 TaxID=1974539 RepID=A0A2H0VHL2_9BACT|nr:MAG: conjugal transfer protein TraC [Candidatus Colwellbacteria bacterium CG10_big_fil_rev_8_21_14_0_10_41_28]
MASSASTQSLIPIDRIQNGIVYMKDKTLRRVVLVDGINFDLKSEDDQKSIISAYQDMLNSLDFPIQINVHSRKLNIEDYLKNLEDLKDTEDNNLMRTQIDEYTKFVESFVGENAIMEKSFFVVVPYDPMGLNIRSSESVISKIVSPKNSDEEESRENHAEQLNLRVSDVVSSLRRIGLRAIPLEDPELLELYFNSYNPSTVEKTGQSVGRKGLRGTDNIANLSAPKRVEIKSKHIKVGEKFSRSLFISDYPRYLSTGWLSPIINTPETMDLSIFIHPSDTGVILKNLRKKVAQIESQISVEAERGLVRNPSLETAFQDAENLRDALTQSREKFFEVGIYMTIHGDTEKELDRIESELISTLDRRLVTLRPAVFEQLKAFQSVAPLAKDRLNIHTALNSGPVSSFFPFVSGELTSDEGVMYGVNRHNNTLVIFDRFSLENANMTIFAKAGAGKSYAAKLDILRSLMLGTSVIVVDPENEYERLAEEVGGSVFKISLDSENNINPFEIPIIPKDETPSEVLKSHVVNLTGLIKLMLGEVSAEEEAILDQAITETYASRDITPDTDFDGKTPPLLEDLESVLRNMDGGKNMAERLYRFTKGSYAGFTNKPTNVDINNRLIVFSIRDLEDELRPVAMYIILNFIWSLVRAKLEKRLMVIDEAWIMMRNEDSASFLFGLAKRARKYYLGITTITQDVEDFLNSPYGKPIITNSSLQLLLKQSTAAIDMVGKAFGLTDVERNYLVETDIGKGLFIAGLKHVAIQVVPSFFEDKLITTNPEDILESEGL